MTCWRQPTSTNSSIRRATSSRIGCTQKLASTRSNWLMKKNTMTRWWNPAWKSCTEWTISLCLRPAYFQCTVGPLDLVMLALQDLSCQPTNYLARIVPKRVSGLLKRTVLRRKIWARDTPLSKRTIQRTRGTRPTFKLIDRASKLWLILASAPFPGLMDQGLAFQVWMLTRTNHIIKLWKRGLYLRN